VATVVLGTLLNPLNSSMIAVALGTLQRDFRIDLGTLQRDFRIDLGSASWLISGFYLAAAVAAATPMLAIVAVGIVLGVPNGFNNLGLQAALYEDAPPAQTGAAAELFQTARYVGAILATSLIGITFSGGVSTTGLHTLAAVIAAIAALLVLVTVAAPRRRARRSGRAARA